MKKGISLRWLPIGFILLQSLLYGFGDPISKSAYEVLPVYSLLTARYGIALVFLLLLFGRRIFQGLRACSPKDWLLPSLCMGGAYVANNIALELTSATSVAFLRSLSTVMTPLLALAVYRRRMGKQHIPVQLVVILGLYLLCGQGGLSGFGWGGTVLPPLRPAAGGVFDLWGEGPESGGSPHPHRPADRRLPGDGSPLRPVSGRRGPPGGGHPHHLGHHPLPGLGLHRGRLSAAKRRLGGPVLPGRWPSSNAPAR